MAIKKLDDMVDGLDVRREPPVTQYLSTGCDILDLAIADRLPGGFGAGRINHIWGTESSSKSMLVAEVMRSSQAAGGFIELVDSETTFDMVRAETLHDLNVNNLTCLTSDDLDEKQDLTVEYLFDTVIKEGLVKANKKVKAPDLIAIDSLSAISSEVEVVDDISTKTYGATRAKAMSTGFRKYIWKLTEANLTLLFVDQTRDNVGVTFGSKYVRSGGNALGFYASTRIFTKVDSKLKNKYGKVVGIVVEFKVDKNKIAPPFREGKFRILFDYGVDNVGTNILWLKENDPDYKAGKGYYEFNGKKLQGLDKMITYIENEKLEKALSEEVYRVWKIVYEPIDRIRRRR